MDVISPKLTIERYYLELWNHWDLALIDELIDEAIEFRGSLGVHAQGRDEFRQYVERVRTAFPNFHNETLAMISEHDRVAVRLRYRGTHSGPLFGVAATGKKIDYAGMALFRVSRNRIIEGYVLGDVFNLMTQIGAVTRPPGMQP